MIYFIVVVLIFSLMVYSFDKLLATTNDDYNGNQEPEPIKNYYEPIKSEVNITSEIVEVDIKKEQEVLNEECVQIVRDGLADYIGAPGESTVLDATVAIEDAIVIEEVKPEVLKTPSKPRTRKPRVKKEVLK